MSVDNGFTSAFGGTFGVVLALVVIFFLLPMLGCIGCTGCAMITGAVGDSIETRNEIRSEQMMEERRQQLEEFNREAERQKQLREREAAEQIQRIRSQEEAERQELEEARRKQEAEWYRKTYGDRKEAADRDTQDVLRTINPTGLFGGGS